MVGLMREIADGTGAALDRSASDAEYEASASKFLAAAHQVQPAGQALKEEVGVDWNRPQRFRSR